MPTIKKEQTIAFSGHRIISKGINKEFIKKIILYKIDNGYNTFLNGLAIGFDSIILDILLEIKKIKDIKIIGVLPCERQDELFNKKQKEAYKNYLKKIDDVIVISKEYTKNCMFERNRFLVDNSNCLICYLKYDKGGTKYTYNYAIKKEKEIINVAEI